MPAGQGQILGSRVDNTTQRVYMMDVTDEGAIPISGVLSVSVGAITTGSESYLYGKSGTSWWPLLVESGTGKLISTASVTVDRVYIASGADIGSVWLKNGAYVNIIPSGTFYSTGSINIQTGGFVSVIASGTLGLPISGVLTITNLATAGSLAIQNVIGSIYNLESIPTSTIYNNSRIAIIYSGTVIGSVWKFIGAGSYVQSLSYTGNNLTGISPWSVV